MSLYLRPLIIQEQPCQLFTVYNVSFLIKKMGLISDLPASTGYCEVQMRSYVLEIEMLARISMVPLKTWGKVTNSLV